MSDLLELIRACWKTTDGIPMVDYSSQQPGKRAGAHTEHIDSGDFSAFLAKTRDYDFDVMLEIKDKEASARVALSLARDDPRMTSVHAPG